MLEQKSIAWRSIGCRLLPALLFLLVFLVGSEVGACPTCKQGLAENSPAAQAMANGYFYSILFMMSMPFLILGTFGSCAYWSIRRARQ
ncbi:MAG: hypothetical protein ABGX16_10480 [Pirellulales bacterium]